MLRHNLSPPRLLFRVPFGCFGVRRRAGGVVAVDQQRDRGLVALLLYLRLCFRHAFAVNLLSSHVVPRGGPRGSLVKQFRIVLRVHPLDVFHRVWSFLGHPYPVLGAEHPAAQEFLDSQRRLDEFGLHGDKILELGQAHLSGPRRALGQMIREGGPHLLAPGAPVGVVPVYIVEQKGQLVFVQEP